MNKNVKVDIQIVDTLINFDILMDMLTQDFLLNN